MKYELNNNHILEVIQDESAESPNDWGNTDIFLVYEHRSFQVDREAFKPRTVYNWLESSIKEREEHFVNNDFDKYWIFTVYAYIHSGVSLSLGRGTSSFDISSSGYLLVEKESIRSGNATIILTEEKAIKYAKDLIDTWNTYLSGEIYGFRLYKKEPYTKVYKDTNIIDDEVYYNCEEVDSCWGFYGSDFKTNGILDHIDVELTKDIKFEE